MVGYKIRYSITKKNVSMYYYYLGRFIRKSAKTNKETNK